MLRSVSGFSLFRRSSSRASNPTTHGVTLRGLSASGASRGLVLLDGVPLNDGFGGWVTWTRLPTDALDNVRVNRGAGGDTYGSDALGGVISFTTPSTRRRQTSATRAVRVEDRRRIRRRRGRRARQTVGVRRRELVPDGRRRAGRA